MKLHSLHDLLVHELRDLYSAENQLIKALPKVAKTASNAELRQAVETHLEETREQADRLERIFEMLEVSPRSKKCAAMEGLIEECKELMGEDLEGAVMDAGLIAAAQKVEHYEMAGYGCARTWAEQLDLGEVATLLQETLNEEKAADDKLTQIAEQLVNREAEEEEPEPAGAGGKGSRGRSQNGRSVKR